MFFKMGAIHGNETAAAEDSLEFAYDLLLTALTNRRPRRCSTRCASSTCPRRRCRPTSSARGRLHRYAGPELERGADGALPQPPGPQRALPEPDLRVAGRRALADHGHRHARRDAEDHEGPQPLHRADQAEHDAGDDRPAAGNSRRTSSPRSSFPRAAASRGTSTRPCAPCRPSRPTASTPARAGSSVRAGRSRAARPTARCCRPARSWWTRATWRTSRSARPPASAAPVPATLSLSMGAPATFGAFTPHRQGVRDPDDGERHLDRR